MNTTVRHFVAEFVGVLALVFVGSGAIMMAAHTPLAATLPGIALAHGLILAVLVSATMNVSGGQLNPAVTIGLLVGRRIPPTIGAACIVAQLAGAIVAAYLLQWLMPQVLFETTRAGGQSVSLDITMGQAIGLEAIGTFLLMFVIYGVAVTNAGNRAAGLSIGLTLGAVILAIGPLTGASLNPARSFGPALASGVWEGQIVYWIGPILGAVIAALIWEFVLIQRQPTAPAK